MRTHRRDLVLLLENLNAAHERKSGVHQHSELTGEGRKVLRLDTPLKEGRQLDVDLNVLVEGTALFRRSGSLLRRRLLSCCGGSRALDLTDCARSKPRRTDRRYRLRTVGRINCALLLFTLGILCDVLKCRHYFPSID